MHVMHKNLFQFTEVWNEIANRKNGILAELRMSIVAILFRFSLFVVIAANGGKIALGLMSAKVDYRQLVEFSLFTSEIEKFHLLNRCQINELWVYTSCSCMLSIECDLREYPIQQLYTHTSHTWALQGTSILSGNFELSVNLIILVVQLHFIGYYLILI